MRDLTSTVGIRDIPEEAHHERNAEERYPAASLSPTRWAGAPETNLMMRVVSTHVGELSHERILNLGLSLLEMRF